MNLTLIVKIYGLLKEVQFKSEKSASELKTGIDINFVIYDIDGDFNTKNDQIKIEGGFELGADFELDANIEKFNMDYLQFKYDFSEVYELEAEIGLAGADLLKKENEKEIAKIPCGTYLVPIGIPVVIEPVIVLKAGIGIETSVSCEMGISNETTTTTVIKYDEGQWTTEKEIEKVFNVATPDFKGEIEAKVYIKPELKFKIYKVVAPYIDAELYGKAEVEYKVVSNSLDWGVSVGLATHAGVKAEIFHKSLVDFKSTIFEIEEIILEGQVGNFNEEPVANFTITAEEKVTGQEIIFDASSCTDKEDPLSDLEVKWDFDGDGTWDTEFSTDKTATKIFSEPGTYSVWLAVKDTKGATGLSFQELIIEEAPTYSYGSFTDSRDGKTYKTVTIGGKEWMAENLAYDVGDGLLGIQ